MAGVGHVLQVRVADVGADADDEGLDAGRERGLCGGDGLGLTILGIGLRAGVGLAVGREHDVLASRDIERVELLPDDIRLSPVGVSPTGADMLMTMSIAAALSSAGATSVRIGHSLPVVLPSIDV
jgi:hypothetical protein